MEEYGIGRPSTYASILETIKKRKYVELDNKRFVITDVGRVVSKFLSTYFTKYVDYNFTAYLESNLDEIACGKLDFLFVLKEFWKGFKMLVDEISINIKHTDVTREKIAEKCPECSGELHILLGKTNRFIGCVNYPTCKYTKGLDSGDGEARQETDKKCPKCSFSLIIKTGRYGKFLGCGNYPNCKHIEPLEKPKQLNVKCPGCSNGFVVEKKTRAGKVFYSCERYPDCEFASWYKPIKKTCPDCGVNVLYEKFTKKNGQEIFCTNSKCTYKLQTE